MKNFFQIQIFFVALMAGQPAFGMDVKSLNATSGQTLQISFIAAVKRNDVATARDLLEKGADHFCQDSEGLSGLDYTAKLGPKGIDMRKLLLEKCLESHVIVSEVAADESPSNRRLSTPSIAHNRKLLQAFWDENPKEFKRLLKSCYADINSKPSVGAAPLWLELRRRYVKHRNTHPVQPIEGSKTLLKKMGINFPSLSSQQRNDPIMNLYDVLVAHEKRLKGTRTIPQLDHLLRAIVELDTEEIHNLAGKTGDINGHDVNGYTPLGLALSDNPSCIPLLCQHAELDANRPFPGKYGLSSSKNLIYPLEHALDLFAIATERAQNGNWATADYFAGCEPPACQPERALIIRCLSEKGASIPPQEAPHNQGEIHSLLALALGVELPTTARRRSGEYHNLTSTLHLTQERLENLMICYFWAVDGVDFTDSANSPCRYGFFLKAYENFEATVHETPLFIDFIKKRLSSAWKIDPHAINQQDSRGMTPLMWAAARGTLELAQFLVTFPSLDLTVIDHFFGFNALHFAIRNGHISLVNFLLGIPGMHRIQKTASGLSPYQLATQCKRENIIDHLDARNTVRIHLVLCFKKSHRVPREICRLIFRLL